MQIPPLRDRIEDLPELIQTFMHKFSSEVSRQDFKLSRKAWLLLQQYNWPGNVRELKNVLKAIIQLSNGEQITEDALPIYIRRQKPDYTRINGTLEEILFQVEEQILQEYLENEKDKIRIAEKLGISRSTLYEKIKKHNL